MWEKEQLSLLVKSRGFSVAAASAMSLAVGLGTGIFMTRRKYEAIMQETIDREIEATKEFYAKLNKSGDYSDPEKMAEGYADEASDEPLSSEALKKAAEALTNYQGIPATTQTVVENVFEKYDAGSTFGDDVETIRTPDRPYIISEEEYLENEPDHDQVRLTYFEEDDVLIDDESSQPIPDVDRFVGVQNLRFGYRSKDPSAVFVRNEPEQRDFEVTRDEGSYAKKVLGFIERDRSLEHSRKGRKFRGDDG